MFFVCCLGAACGIANGLAARAAIVRALDKSDKVFYRVWAGGFLYRLAFLGLSALVVWRLDRESAAAFLLPLCMAQFVFQVVPVGYANRTRIMRFPWI